MKKIIFFFVGILLLSACDKDPGSANANLGNFTLGVKYINQTPLVKAAPVSIKNAHIESIRIERARFLIRDVRLKTTIEDSIEFVSDPLILEPDLNSGENILAVKDVPAGTYNRVEFRVHRLDDDDPRDQDYFLHPDFADFVTDKRYSMIIEGVVFEAGSSVYFRFLSRENETQEHYLNPAVTVDGIAGDVTVMMVIDGSGWFLAEDGSLLDPRDPANEDEISENLENSIDMEHGDKFSDDGSDDRGDDMY